MSVGVKGLRIGTGPRGHYVNIGRSGLYYRASLGRAGERVDRRTASDSRTLNEPIQAVSNVEMIEIESDDVMSMRDEGFADLLDEINQKQRQISATMVLAACSVVVAIGTYFAVGVTGLASFLLLIPTLLVGRWFDSYRRSTVLYYDLDDSVREIYEAVTLAYDDMMSCDKKWHIAAGGDIRDLTTWKRNAGASKLVDKKPTTLAYGAPRIIKSNVTPPSLQVGKQTIYFFPDVALVEDGGRFGAVGYQSLHVNWEDSPFIEDGAVPKDARVIGNTWKHPNKSGGPDRRFRDNRQIPICLYETMRLNSHSGVNEAVQFSRTGVSQRFAQGLKAMPGQTLGVSSKIKNTAEPR